MEFTSNKNVVPVEQEATSQQMGQNDGSDGSKPARYVPPGRRASPISTSSEEEAVQLREQSSLFPIQPKVRTAAPARNRSANASSQPRTRTPSPTGSAPIVTRDTQTGEPVEIWQGKRKGGNRAPTIEPAGTKSWREPQKQVLQKEAELAMNLTLTTGPGILLRLYEYAPVLLDTIDMHLNVLLRCIAPETQNVSVRDIPWELFPAIAEGRLVAEILRKKYSMGLPGRMSIVDFFAVLSSTLDLIPGVGLPHLVYLLDCERVLGRTSRCFSFSQVFELLHSFAVAQLNWDCCKDLSPIPSREDSPISFETRRYILGVRESLAHIATQTVRRHFFQHSLAGAENYATDMTDLTNGPGCENLAEDRFRMWFCCLTVRWCGLIKEVPNYPKLLRRAGFYPGGRAPIQLRNPREPKGMYELVSTWLNMNEAADESGDDIWSPPAYLH